MKKAALDFLSIMVGVAAIFILGQAAKSAHAVQSQHADFDAGALAPISLEMSPCFPGMDAFVRVRIDDASNVQEVSLVLQFQTDLLFSASALDFRRNPVLLPEISLGDHALNTARDVSFGRIRIIGLAPAAITGPAKIGSLRLHISPNASIGATQTITLTGEINYADAGVVTIEPVIAVVRVVEIKNFVFLPVIMRNR